MRPLLLVLLLGLIGCPPTRSSGDDDDDSATDDDDAADDDDDMGDCPAGVCELTTLEANGTCEGPEPEPMPPDNMLVTSPAAGQVSVMHFNVAEGCCPEVQVLGYADLQSELITVEVDLSNDFCDCICILDVSYLLDDVPPGRWQVRVEPFGAMGEVMVE